MNAPLSLFDKIWDRVCLTTRDDGYSLLYIDRHIGHEGLVGGFAGLRERGLELRRPDLLFGTADHFVSTRGDTLEHITNPKFRQLVTQFASDAAEFGRGQLVLVRPITEDVRPHGGMRHLGGDVHGPGR